METTFALRSVAHPRSDDYVLTDVREPRPASGWAEALVECEFCGQPVTCRVAGVEEVQRLRARWRLTAIVCVVAIPVMAIADVVTFTGISPEKPASGLVSFLLAFSFVLAALCFMGARYARRLARQEDGVRLAGARGEHRLSWTSYKSSD